MVTMINIYLDDVRPCPSGFILSRNVRHCLHLLKEHKGNIKVLSLDHDMGHGTSGYWLVKQMVRLGLYAEHIYIHSANPIGREKMFLCLLDGVEQGSLPPHIKIYNGNM